MPHGEGSIMADADCGMAAAKPAAPATPRKLRRVVEVFIAFSVIRILPSNSGTGYETPRLVFRGFVACPRIMAVPELWHGVVVNGRRADYRRGAEVDDPQHAIQLRAGAMARHQEFHSRQGSHEAQLDQGAFAAERRT